jgi:hypothetical protein
VKRIFPNNEDYQFAKDKQLSWSGAASILLSTIINILKTSNYVGMFDVCIMVHVALMHASLADMLGCSLLKQEFNLFEK